MDKRKIIIVLAVACAALAAILFNSYISRTEKKFIREEKRAYVVMAAVNIAAGTTIDETMIKVASVPELYLQPRALSSPSVAVGKRAVVDIIAGEQVLPSKLALATKDSSLAMRTPQGKRAITITVPYLSAVGGKLRPGDYVDIIGSFPYASQVEGRQVNEMVSVTLFQNVLVLSIEGGAPAERGKPAPAPTDLMVTFALTPKEIAMLTYVQDQGKLRLVLRPPLETAVQPVPPVEVNAMWQYVFSNLGKDFVSPQDEQAQGKNHAKETTMASPQPTLEVYRGTEKSNMVIK